MNIAKCFSVTLFLVSQSLLYSSAQSQPNMSNVCRTPYGACYLQGSAPIGTPCWCGTPYGPVAGSVR